MENDFTPVVSLDGYNKIFNIPSGDDSTIETIQEIKLDELEDFKQHPYFVNDDVSMKDLIESIKSNGQLIPIIVRKVGKKYEIVSGHRRKRACELAGFNTIKAIVKDLSDDDATILMVDSNMFREKISFREKSEAYRMKYQALCHQGKKSVMESGQSVRKLEIEGSFPENERTVRRIIRLTELRSSIVDMLDEGKIGFLAAVQLSFLKPAEQEMVESMIEKISETKAKKLRELSNTANFTKSKITEILSKSECSDVITNVNIKDIDNYFPRNYTKERIIETIHSLLNEWKASMMDNPDEPSVICFHNGNVSTLQSSPWEDIDSTSDVPIDFDSTPAKCEEVCKCLKSEHQLQIQ